MNIDDFLSEDASLRKFFQGYLEAMCFTDLPDEFAHSGQFYIGEWGEKFSTSLLYESFADCARFVQVNSDLIPDERMQEAGQDFWMTRTLQGCGFWDGDWGDKLGDTLTEVCKVFTERHMYIDEQDGLLYLEMA